MSKKHTCPYCQSIAEREAPPIKRQQHSHSGTREVVYNCSCGYESTHKYTGTYRAGVNPHETKVKETERVPQGYVAVVNEETKEVVNSVSSAKDTLEEALEYVQNQDDSWLIIPPGTTFRIRKNEVQHSDDELASMAYYRFNPGGEIDKLD